MPQHTMPADPKAYAAIADPVQRAWLRDKLERYVARGQWAQAALAHLLQDPKAAPSDASPPASPPRHP